MLKDSRAIIQRLEADGFRLLSVRGSHHKFRHDGTGRTVIVAHPRRDMPLGIVHAIYRQAGWAKD